MYWYDYKVQKAQIICDITDMTKKQENHIF